MFSLKGARLQFHSLCSSQTLYTRLPYLQWSVDTIKEKSVAKFPIVSETFTQNHRKIYVPEYSDVKTDKSSANSSGLAN